MGNLKIKELQQLKLVLATLAVGLIIVISLIVLREIKRSNAIKNIEKNTIEVPIPVNHSNQ